MCLDAAKNKHCYRFESDRIESFSSEQGYLRCELMQFGVNQY